MKKLAKFVLQKFQIKNSKLIRKIGEGRRRETDPEINVGTILQWWPQRKNRKVWNIASEYQPLKSLDQIKEKTSRWTYNTPVRTSISWKSLPEARTSSSNSSDGLTEARHSKRLQLPEGFWCTRLSSLRTSIISIVFPHGNGNGLRCCSAARVRYHSVCFQIRIPISITGNSVFRERIVQTNDEADAEERLEMRCLCGQQISRQQNRKQSEYQSVPTLEYEYSVRKMSIYR